MVTFDEPTEYSSPMEEAAAEKALGNDAYVRKDCAQALAHYNRAIELDPLIGTYFSNRAMCNITLEKWQDAYDDCCSAMKLEVNDCKIFMRRGKALEKLGRLTEAVRDFASGLKIEPRNSQLLENHDRVTEMIHKIKQQSPVRLVVDEVSEFSTPDFDLSESKESNIPQDLSSVSVPDLEGYDTQTNSTTEPTKVEKPKVEPKKTETEKKGDEKPKVEPKKDEKPKVEPKKAETEKKGDEKPKVESKKDEKPKVEPKKTETEKKGDEKPKVEPKKEEKAKTETPKVTADAKPKVKTSPETQSHSLVEAKPLPAVAAEKLQIGKRSKMLAESDFATKMILDQIIPDLQGLNPDSSNAKEDNSPVSNTPPAKVVKLEEKIEVAPAPKPPIPRDIFYFMIKEKKELPPKKKINEVFASLKIKKNPQKSAEFESTCRLLSARNDFTLYAYIQLLPSSKYNTLFENGITLDVFDLIIIALDEYAPEEDAFTTLRSMASLKRFGATMMMISNKAATSLLSIFAQVHRAIGTVPKITLESYNSLHQQYNVPKILDKVCAL